jgi:hypothetical protein
VVLRCEYDRRIGGGRIAMRIEAHSCVGCFHLRFTRVFRTIAVCTNGGKYPLNRPHPSPSPVSGDGALGVVARRKIGELEASGIKVPPPPDIELADGLSRTGVFLASGENLKRWRPERGSTSRAPPIRPFPEAWARFAVPIYWTGTYQD